MIVLPVIHYDNLKLAISNSEMAFENGCDGIFVINMDYTAESDIAVETACAKLKKIFPNKKIGANFLYSDFMSGLTNNLQVLDMLWTDVLIPPSLDSMVTDQLSIKPIEIFESFSFKYKRVDHNFIETGKSIYSKGRVPTTSGNATGSAPALEKILQLQELPKLALASGLTPENISQFKPYITHALVATGISETFFKFDPIKMRDFVQAANS